MSEEPPVYQEGETVPVPDKGGWIDGETGQVLPTPAPEVVEPVKQPQPGVVQTEPKPETKPAPPPKPSPKAA